MQVAKDIVIMELGLQTCGVLVLKRGKVVSSVGVEMPDSEKIKEVEENEYKHLSILTL